MLVLLGVGTDLRNLGLRNLIGEYTTDAFAPRMHFQHHPGGLLAVHRKYALKYIHYKLHRRVVVIQQQHPVKRWSLEPGPGLLNGEPPPVIGTSPEILVTRTVVTGIIHCLSRLSQQNLER